MPLMDTSKIYGLWQSTFTPRALAETTRISDVQPNHYFGWVWVESRPTGNVLVAKLSFYGAPYDLTSSDLSVRGKIGYGGGEFTIIEDQVVFVGAPTVKGGHARLYTFSLHGGKPYPITPAFGSPASPRFSPNGEWIAYVLSDDGVDGIALVDADGETFPRRFAYGDDFAMQPAWSPDGNWFAYVAWNLPHMPFNSAEVRLCTLTTGSDGAPVITERRTIAGSETVSATQPEFSADGRYLTYISDEAGRSHLYLHDLETSTARQLTTDDADYRQAPWIQGQRSYGWRADSKSIVAIRYQNAASTLVQLGVDTGETIAIELMREPYFLTQLTHNEIDATMIVSSRWAADHLISAALPPTATPPDPKRVSRSTRFTQRDTGLPGTTSSSAQHIDYPTPDGETAYGLYYPPAGMTAAEVAADTQKPPLIVFVHGGPTSQEVMRWRPEIQYYCSRGFAVFAPNHRGSTGYGRAYQDKLQGNWGVYDVEDSASGAAWLAAQGWCHPTRWAILGGSAGGFTVLQSLINKPGVYKAGISLYGVSDQIALALETFKFESGYSDYLLGALPDAAPLYRERSPVYHADRIQDPLLLFHGREDDVVPPSQSERIAAVVRGRGVPCDLVLFDGEGHGFRKPDTIETYLTRTVEFLTRYVIFA